MNCISDLIYRVHFDGQKMGQQGQSTNFASIVHEWSRWFSVLVQNSLSKWAGSSGRKVMSNIPRASQPSIEHQSVQPLASIRTDEQIVSSSYCCERGAAGLTCYTSSRSVGDPSFISRSLLLEDPRVYRGRKAHRAGNSAGHSAGAGSLDESSSPEGVKNSPFDK